LLCSGGINLLRSGRIKLLRPVAVVLRTLVRRVFWRHGSSRAG
jgi:hypothetical protein